MDPEELAAELDAYPYESKYTGGGVDVGMDAFADFLQSRNAQGLPAQYQPAPPSAGEAAAGQATLDAMEGFAVAAGGGAPADPTQTREAAGGWVEGQSQAPSAQPPTAASLLSDAQQKKADILRARAERMQDRRGPGLGGAVKVAKKQTEELERQYNAAQDLQAERQKQEELFQGTLDAQLERRRQIEDQYNKQLAAIEEKEAEAQFIADHPNASEAELRQAYAIINDPTTTDERKAKVQAALERTRELNPYRMVSTPGGMLAAVASIIASGIGGAQDPAEQLNKALENDLNLQKQRQANRRDKVMRIAKQRGQEAEARARLIQMEDMEDNITQRKFASAMRAFEGQAKTQEAQNAFRMGALSIEERLADKRASAAAQAQAIKEQGLRAVEEAELAEVQAQEANAMAMAERERERRSMTVAGTSTFGKAEPIEGVEITKEQRSKVANTMDEGDKLIERIAAVEDALTEFDSMNRFTSPKKMRRAYAKLNRAWSQLITKEGINVSEGVLAKDERLTAEDEAPELPEFDTFAWGGAPVDAIQNALGQRVEKVYDWTDGLRNMVNARVRRTVERQNFKLAPNETEQAEANDKAQAELKQAGVVY